MKTSFLAQVHGIRPHCKIALTPRRSSLESAEFCRSRLANRLLALTRKTQRERGFSALPEEAEEEEEEEERRQESGSSLRIPCTFRSDNPRGEFQLIAIESWSLHPCVTPSLTANVRLSPPLPSPPPPRGRCVRALVRSELEAVDRTGSNRGNFALIVHPKLPRPDLYEQPLRELGD